MPVSKANGVDIYYETAGEGPAMVLVHAMPFDHHLWLYQADYFSSRFKVIAMDLRGWGRSAKPHAAFTLGDMGDDILGVMRDEGVTNDAVIVGCSVGSKLALMLACEKPKLFRAAVLIGGNSGPQHQFDHRIAAYRDQHAAGTLKDYHLGHLRYGVTAAWADTPLGRHLLDGFVTRGENLDPEAIANVFRALSVSDLTSLLPVYKTPTLILNGEHDNARAAGTKTAALIPHAEHRILSDTGHCCFIEDPVTANGLITDFLKRNAMWPALPAA